MEGTIYIQDDCEVKIQMDDNMPLISVGLGTNDKSRAFSGCMFKFAHTESYRKLAALLIKFADAADKIKEETKDLM